VPIENRGRWHPGKSTYGGDGAGFATFREENKCTDLEIRGIQGLGK